MERACGRVVDTTWTMSVTTLVVLLLPLSVPLFFAAVLPLDVLLCFAATSATLATRDDTSTITGTTATTITTTTITIATTQKTMAVRPLRDPTNHLVSPTFGLVNCSAFRHQVEHD